MSRGGALRGVMTAWLGLIALQSLSKAEASNRVTELAGNVATFIDRALDPTIPAIPDLRAGETWGTGAPAQIVSPSGPSQGSTGGRFTGRVPAPKPAD